MKNNGLNIVNQLKIQETYGEYIDNFAAKCLNIWNYKSFKSDEYSISGRATTVEGSNIVENSPIYACKFGIDQDTCNLLALGNEDGLLTIQDTSVVSNETDGKLTGIFAHMSTIYDLCWFPGQKKIVTGCAQLCEGDALIKLWNIREDGEFTFLQTFVGHTFSVKAIDVNPYDPCVFATGSRDGSIIIWDTRCRPHQKADEILPAHVNANNGGFMHSPSVRKTVPINTSSVTAIKFLTQHSLISSSSSTDGAIKVWDLRRTHAGSKRDPVAKHILEHPTTSNLRSFSSLSISPSRHMLYASCLDNNIYGYHLAGPTSLPVCSYEGHTCHSYHIKSCLSPCGSYILSGSNDRNAYIWLTERPGLPIATLTDHQGDVSSVAWSSSKDSKFVTCTDGMDHRLFKFNLIPKQSEFDIKVNLRGSSVPYKSIEGITSKCEKYNLYKLPKVSDKNQWDIHLPVTPSSSKHKNTQKLTPGPPVQGERIPITPSRSRMTPNANRSISVPTTPKSNERSSLLGWLSATKSPYPTYNNSPSSSNNSFLPSRRSSLKRKLTDIMESEQENDSADKKKPTSPTKNILCQSNSMDSLSPRSSVAKTLYYEEPAPSKKKKVKVNCEENTDIDKPLLDENSIDFRKGFFNADILLSPDPKSYNKPSLIERSPLIKNNVISQERISFSSPTHKLPNIVMDGCSPHRRPEYPTRKEQKRTDNWLSALSKQQKNSTQTSTNSSQKIKGKQKWASIKKPKILTITKKLNFFKKK